MYAILKYSKFLYLDLQIHKEKNKMDYLLDGDSKYIYCLDAGHGGMIDGKYQTDGKRYTFTQPDGFTLYEGVFNRKVVGYLKDMLFEENINFVDLVRSEKDISLRERVDRANWAESHYGNTVYVSVHGNAVGNESEGRGINARGFSVWTSIGQTKSDKMATKFYEALKNEFPELKHRKDTSDGDVDYESRFYVLSKTKSPAVLTENLFFTNFEDAKIMNSEEGQKRIAKAHLEAIKQIDKTI